MAWLGLVMIGLVMVASAAVAQPGGADYYIARHAAFAVAAVAAFLAFLAIPLRTWEIVHKPCLLLAFALCAAVFVPSLSVEVKGAQRWIDIGIGHFQPAEAAKLLAVVYLAGHVARSSDDISRRWQALLTPLAWIGALMTLILYQPDFGSVVVLAALTGAMLFLGGARLRDFTLLMLLAVIGLAALAALEPYRMARMASFLDPWASPLDDGYQLIQALIAFGRGEFLGLGLGEGVQKLFYLPEAHNDFIYAVIAEELGLVGALAVLALLGFVTLRMLRIGRRALSEQRVFAGLVAYGAALLIGMQTVVSAGVNTGVLPTKGLTLPFISFGGNSLLICSALVALAERVHYEGSSETKAAARSRRWVAGTTAGGAGG